MGIKTTVKEKQKEIRKPVHNNMLRYRGEEGTEVKTHDAIKIRRT